MQSRPQIEGFLTARRETSTVCSAFLALGMGGWAGGGLAAIVCTENSCEGRHVLP